MMDKIAMPNGFVSPPMEQEDSLSPSGSAVPSPCVDICRLDSDFVCEGCDRTIDEILKWPEYTDQQKHAVLDRLFNDKG